MTDEDKGAKNKSEIALAEEKVLKFWQENKIFEKSLEKPSPKGEFLFYDGPPFATGLPHYGHLLPGTIKDVVPRYKTMRGYKVPRRWGWDTHGLPIENLIEKELDLKTKQDIEEYGIDKFNQAARESVFRYDKEWKKSIPRTGRWIDMDNPYVTMTPQYTESVWWAFKTLSDKKLLSEGFKSMHLCPRCETTLSNFEVNQGYEEVTDISVYAKFELEKEPGTFVLAWTTTPWTLPGNVALAISKDIEYIKVKKNDSDEKYIIAKDLADHLFENVVGEKYTELEKVSAEDLLGKSYKPLFDYYSSDKNLENVENGWKIYDADFVTTEEGTGVVHIAPAFGSDDYDLSREKKLPFVQHVGKNGKFKQEVKDFVGLAVKEKDNHQSTDIEIIKHLAHADKLFAKKKINHSYPHCWRCDTPLLNYSTSSWFIDVPKIRDTLVNLNDDINWVPETIGKNRFGNWLKEAKEWAISRSRFWGAPLPVWKSEDGEEVAILGSVEDIKNKTRKLGKVFMMRHGEADHNVKEMLNDDDEVPSHVTENGKKQIEASAKELASENIDMIFSSPLVRTKETSEMVAEKIGFDKTKIIYDERIRETNTGISNSEYSKYRNFFKSQREKFDKAHPGGETLTEMKHRVGDFLYELNEKYEGKNILIITHEYPVWMMHCVSKGLDKDASAELKEGHGDFIGTGAVMELDFAPIPHNKDQELDFHRPYIDEVTFEQNGKQMQRIEDVFDVWIDSGSVPFASFNYPQEGRVNPEQGKGYPADFIAEGLDQTRGWFYTMLVLNTALFGKAPYKNVIVNGLILAEDGRKMSKRLKNYPELDYVLDKYGADALRYFLLASQAVRAEDLNFSEKGVDEVVKKLLLRLKNVVSFYELYKENEKGFISRPLNGNVLDRWILARLDGLQKEVTESMEAYELDRATRPFIDFIDDLSTWYLRRSRDRFKNLDSEDGKNALNTLRYVLYELSITLAPFTPFIAEEVYKQVGGTKESVHLEDWPISENVVKKYLNKIFKKPGTNILEDMEKVREVVSLALEARTEAGIKVRQPLATLFVKDDKLANKNDLIEVIKDEVNVKAVAFDATLDDEVKLDTNITPELQQEGDLRELIRFIQSLRKQAKLKQDDEIGLTLSSNVKYLVNKFEEELKSTCNIKDVDFGEGKEEVQLSDKMVRVSIK